MGSLGAMEARGYAYTFLALGLTVYGQLIVKWRVDEAGELPSGLGSQFQFALRLLIDPWVFSSLVFAGVAALAYFAALTQLPVSRAYPVMALSFVVVVLASAPLYGEAITAAKLCGLTLIIAGVFVATRL